MRKNIISPPTDDKVVFVFDFQQSDFAENGLDNFDEITLEIGDESYSNVNNPAELYKDGINKLVLNIGDSTSLPDGSYVPKILGFNINNDDGVTLNSPSIPNLDSFVFVIRG